MAISIIVADDHPLTRSGLAGFIRENGAYALLGEAEDGVRAWELIREHTPDIALLDIRMPGEDGVTVTRRIRASGLRTRVIMLTSYDARSYVMASLMAGASGFVLKTSAIRELAAAIDRVLAGGIYLDPNAGDALRERESAPEALTARANMRRGRRGRNARYRAPRFLNRRKPKGWLAPSLRHRVDTTMSWVKRICRWAPAIAAK